MISGFVHEHTRVDRDQYIDLDYDMINRTEREDFVRADTYAKQFRLCNKTKIGELFNCKILNAYDKSSIMHYKNTIGINQRQIFSSRQPCENGDCNFGQREYLSPTDIKDIEDAYGCGE